jgi:hypothetical protein
MDNRSFLILLIFIVIILAAWFDSTGAFVLGTLALCGTYYYSNLKERFYTGNDWDDLDLSPEGNISESGDIDTLSQRQLLPANDAGIDSLGISDPTDEFDNADIVAEVVGRGNTVFQPIGLGVSDTTSAQMSPFVLGAPSGVGVLDDNTQFNNPQNNKNSIDELLGRAQQHRGAINKKAIDGHVRSTRHLYQKYFTAELDENSNRDWYGNSGTELETDFTTYDL